MATHARAADNTSEKVDFARDVRSILSSACFACHGPDAEQREAELRLDTKTGAFALHDGHRAFVPGKPDESEAIRRITSNDEFEKMPPPDSGKKLEPAQIATLRRWVSQGAKWSEHWAFVAPVRPKTPAVRNSAWVRNPIDASVLKRLESEGLTPSPDADRATLLRRLSLDLVGLPPTIEEVDAFLADDSPRAWRTQVDRLLKSPHYGEKWGRHWLDAARYADSDGFEKDKPREVWFYRDWVVNALNRDTPYDRFIIEQLAGDLLPDADQNQRVATGFLRNSMINEEGGVDPEQFRMEAMFDRMDAVGKAVLGLTVQCSQCHNHKYDPLTQRDYYRMFAFLNNSHEARITVYPDDQLKLRRRLMHEIRRLEGDLKQRTPDWPERMAAWERETLAKEQPPWTPVKLAFDAKTIGGQKFLPQRDGSYLAQSYAPTKFRPKMTFETDLDRVTGIRLELLTDPNLPHGGPGRSIEGTAALTEFEVEAAPAVDPGRMQKIKIARATADVALPETPLKPIYDDRSKKRRVTGPVEFAIDGNEQTAWGTDAGPGRRNQSRKAVFTFAAPVAFEGGAVFNVYLAQKHGGWNSDDNQTHNIGRFRISVTSADNPTADPLPKRVREIIETTEVAEFAKNSVGSKNVAESARNSDGREQPSEFLANSATADAAPESETKKDAASKRARTPAEVAAVFSYWRTTLPDWRAVNDKIEQQWKHHPEGSSQLVLMERDRRRETHRLERGEFLKPQEEVQPGVPSFLHPLQTDASRTPTRLDFARWLVDRRSPTTARAFVNRVWQQYFGRGLVGTSEDLGSQGETPTHPKLLDWLAVEFMESGWSMKHLHRLITTSAAYRQSSKASAELIRRDPHNRLLARGPRFRLPAELVRDGALAASGLLNREIGGPSVYPPAPEFLFEPPASYGPKVWDASTGDDKYRRSIYTFRFRSVPYPALEVFDAPNGDTSCVRRDRSNTPLQALTLLNEPLFMEAARALAFRTLTGGGETDAARLEYTFRRCLARKPTAEESAVLLAMFKQQKQRFTKGDVDPWKLAARDVDSLPELPEGSTPVELAAWTAVARVILNLDETITKE